MHHHRNARGLTRRRVIQQGGAAGGAVTLSLVLPQQAWSQNAPPQVVIGQIVPFTGSAAEYGTYYRDAAALALQQINTAAEEVFGGPIVARHVAEDSNTLPTPAIEAARKMVEADNAAALICAWSSGVTVAVATSVTLPSGILQVGNGTTSPLVTVLPEDEGKDLLFRTSPSDLLQGVVAAQLAVGELDPDWKYTRASTIYINNPYGQGLADSFANSFKKRGGTLLAQIAHPEEVQPTYQSQLSAALADDPDLLMLVSYPAHTAEICRESRDTFDYTSWQFVDGNKSTDVLEAVGGEALAGKLGTSPAADPDAAAYQSFAETYKETFGHDRIPPFTANTYDAAAAIGLALAKAVADGLSASEITGKALAERLRPVANSPGDTIVGGSQEEMTKALALIQEGADIQYEGPSGTVNFDEQGDVKTPIGIFEFTEDGIEDVQVVPADEIPSE